MSDLLAFSFGGILLAFGAGVLLIAERFKRRALQEKEIGGQHVRTTVWQMVKVALLAWLGFSLVYSVGFFAGQNQGLEQVGLLVFCLIGPLVVSSLILSSYIAVLWGVLRLPFKSSPDDEEASSKHHTH